jgi:hypothetical protein
MVSATAACLAHIYQLPLLLPLPAVRIQLSILTGMHVVFEDPTNQRLLGACFVGPMAARIRTEATTTAISTKQLSVPYLALLCTTHFHVK